jgi:hypothetical protein
MYSQLNSCHAPTQSNSATDSTTIIINRHAIYYATVTLELVRLDHGELLSMTSTHPLQLQGARILHFSPTVQAALHLHVMHLRVCMTEPLH